MNLEIKAQIEQLLQPLLEDDRIFIVDVKVSLSKLNSKVTILLDSDEGIKIDECRTISKSLGENLDALMPEKYTLEVSSPGVDVLLKSERMYRKNVGRDLKVTLKDATIVKGLLENVEPSQITIIEDKKRKKGEEIVPLMISFDNIKESQVIISFK
jgi:ribosome maturation factor RimP